MGFAHDYLTFLEGYKIHHQSGSGNVILWLNAIGGNSERLAVKIQKNNLPFYRTQPVPLEQLGQLLISVDAHLITLRDEFVGYVLPSKVYGCLDSGKSIVYIGDQGSDVYLLCQQRLDRAKFFHATIGDAQSVAKALDAI